MKRLRLAPWSVLFSLVVAVTVRAQPVDPRALPPDLQPWVPWALDGVDAGCATMGDERVCAWPGSLRLTLSEAGASFVLDVETSSNTAQSLPGTGTLWPLAVTVDGDAAAVLPSSATPTVWLSPGRHRIEGRFEWATAPETLSVPARIARVIVVRGATTSLATRGESGEVWLRETDATAHNQEELGIEVHRLLRDGVPLALTTTLTLRAWGRSRELRLAHVLPEGFIATELTSALPARLTTQGELSVQLRAGTHTITIEARSPNPDQALERPEIAAPWPPQEVWAWQPNEAFRQVQVEGAAGIDPQRTSMPDAWRSFSAFLVDDATTMHLTTLRRGEPTPPPNQLAIARTLWLDIDGEGYSVRDNLQASLFSGHRLELLEGSLGRVSLDGQDQLITQGTEGHPGVELRAVTQSLTAEWRLPDARTQIPAANWSEDATSGNATLNLPPGWLFVEATGVDRAPTAWLERWTLLSLFGLLLIAVALGRTYGMTTGALAFVGLGLAFHEAWLPQYLWLILAALSVLHRALAKRAAEAPTRWLFVGFAILTSLFVIAFVNEQSRAALFPQLATRGAGYDGFDLSTIGAMNRTAPVSSVEYEAAEYGGVADSLSQTRSQSNSAWLDPSSIVQTGFGMPTWDWSAHRLEFDGPIARDQDIHVFLLPPWANRLLHVVRALLVLAVLVQIVRRRPRAPEEPAAIGGSTTSTMGPAAAAIMLAWVGSSGVARAQAPSPELLGELRTRLTRTPSCGDTCADTSRLTLDVSGDRLVFDLEVSARGVVAQPLPGPADVWVPERVLVDGAETQAVVRMPNGHLYVRVEDGAHRVRVEGSLRGRDSLGLAFGNAPRRFTSTAAGWEVDGSGTSERLVESVQLRRILAEGTEEVAPSSLPSWIEVRRRVEIGVRWTVTTTLTRMSPPGTATLLRVPLLRGESVTDATITTEGSNAVINLGPTDTTLSWTSVLAPSDAIELNAPTSPHSNEVWQFVCSPLWHCEHAGIAPTTPNEGGSWQPTFHPWPGEALRLAITRPTPAEGSSFTIDAATLTVSPGARLTESTLSLEARTSTSAALTIELPPDTTVTGLTVGGETRPLQRDGDRMTVSLQPGSHQVEVRLQDERGIGTAFTTPAIRLGNAATNVRVVLRPPSSRWTLWTSGPSWGPAVLMWPWLIVVLGAALALSRWRGTFGFTTWVLLLVGLTQIPVAAAATVVGWFFVIESRRTMSVAHVFFPLRQFAIVAYTGIAALCLGVAIERGLLGHPDMMIEGPNCSAHELSFYVDRIDGSLPVATLLSLPIVVFRVLMFAWALWLAFAVVGWAKWAWEIFRAGGLLFADRPLAVAAPIVSEPHAGPTPVEAMPEPAPLPPGSDEPTSSGPESS